jgi:hypothetical protein
MEEEEERVQARVVELRVVRRRGRTGRGSREKLRVKTSREMRSVLLLLLLRLIATR